MKLRLAVLWALFAPTAFGQSLSAFYGAEGGGALSVGGRAGVVCQVTNLNNSGAGSLRACVEMSGPRTVVFRVGGTINLTSTLSIRHPYITIAGHTAPGGGIQLSGKNNGCASVVRIHTHNVVVRYLRIRKGVCDPPEPGGPDVVGIDGTSNFDNNMYNIVLDHISSFWGHDESMSASANSVTDVDKVPRNITFQYSIMAETLSGHAAGSLITAHTGVKAENMVNIDIHHNIYANTSHRNPLLNNKSSRIVNNIIHNWSGYASKAGPGALADFINNKFSAGPISPKFNNQPPYEIYYFLYNPPTCDISTLRQTEPSLYVVGNIGPHNNNPAADNWPLMVSRMRCMGQAWAEPSDTRYRRATPLPPAGVPITALPVTQLDSYLLPIVGASRRLDCMGNWVSNRDSQDARIINEYQNNQGFIPSSETQVGGFPTIAGGTPCADTDSDGMPDQWEIANGLNLNNDIDRNTVHASGYTMLEMYLNGPMESQTLTLTPPANIRFSQ